MRKEEKKRQQSLGEERMRVDIEKDYLEREKDMIEKEWSTLKREFDELDGDRQKYTLDLFVSMKRDLNRLAEDLERRELRYRERRDVYLEKKNDLESQERVVSRLSKAKKRTAWLKPLRTVVRRMDAETVTVGTVLLLVMYGLFRLFA